MASPVLNESKHIAKRIAIGVATGVSGAVIIYFIGFNRGSREVSEIEMGKNTSKAWKTYVTIENEAQTKFDTNHARGSRAIGTFFLKYRQTDSALTEFRHQDSLVFYNLVKGVEELKETKDIDKEFVILLKTRLAYLEEQIKNAADYKGKFKKIVIDSTMPFDYKMDQLTELNAPYNGKMANIIERLGRGIEDLTGSLSKKYDQAKFSITEFKFYPWYLTLKKKKADPSMPPPVAPPAPDKDKTDPALPK